MLFTSIEFALFLPIVFYFYWFVTDKNLKIQNIFLLIASYVFYGWWDWRFLLLLSLLSVINYFIGINIENNEKSQKRKIWFIVGLIINIGFLGIFKYYNFFIDSFIDLISVLGYDLPRSTTKIILPVGISFYTFLSLSYIIDIQKKTLIANRNIFEVLLTLSFFPIILAGPIQRPATLLPQIAKKRNFNYKQGVDGLKQILWGLFTKVVIADRLAGFVDEIFNNNSFYSGSTLLIGAIFFTIQIYADFSGYSDIAIGTAKLFGFNLMRNFAYPYFSSNISDFWQRWHISLTTWFRTYIFLPMSFLISWNIKSERVFFIRTDLFIYIIASLVTWCLTGLWHGANYTFIIWGMIHGFFLIIYKLQTKPRKRIFQKLGINIKNRSVIIVETLITLFIVIIAWIFFRADNLKEAILYLDGLFSKSLISIPQFRGRTMALISIIFVCIFFIIEWYGREQQYAIANLGSNWGKALKYTFYYIVIIIIIVYGGYEQQFIYFQF